MILVEEGWQRGVQGLYLDNVDYYKGFFMGYIVGGFEWVSNGVVVVYIDCG